MAGDMKIEQVAELQLAYPTFTEAVGMVRRSWCVSWVWRHCHSCGATSNGPLFNYLSENIQSS